MMKIIKIFFLLILQFNIIFGLTPLELNLREIREKYRYSPIEGKIEINNSWEKYTKADDRLRIFLDLQHYYRNNSFHELLLTQGKWLLNKNISSDISKMWVMNLIAHSLSETGNIKESVEFYEKAFTLSCKTQSKDTKNLSRENFIKYGTQGTYLWGEWVIKCSITYAKAGKFDDAYSILKHAKSLVYDEGIKSGRESIDHMETQIMILGLMEGKTNEAREKLKNLNNRKPLLAIEPSTDTTWQEKLCIQTKDYELLINIYLNTLERSPAIKRFTFKQIVVNARENIYVLNKINSLFLNPDFCFVFEKELKEKNMPHLNLMLAEYYFQKQNFAQAKIFYNLTLKNNLKDKSFWPKYYPDMNLDKNYKSPYRIHLWETCSERAKKQLQKISF